MKDYLDEYIVATRLIYRPQGATVKELSKALGKTERAIFTILAQLDSMYFPLEPIQDPENPKQLRYTAKKSFAEYLPDLEFTENDKAVFNYLISNAPNTPTIESDARRLFYKLKLMASERGALIENGYNKPSPIVSALSIQKYIDTKKGTKATTALLDIIKKKEWMDITYKSMNMTKPRKWFRLFPLVMFVWQGDSYLYVLNQYGQLRMLAIERIENILKSYKDTVPEHNYNIKELLSDPFGIIYDHETFDVKLKIAKEESLYIKQKKWPESVKITDNEDGSIIFETKTHSAFDCKRWILEKTPFVKVIEPEWIKDEIKAALEEGIKNI